MLRVCPLVLLLVVACGSKEGDDGATGSTGSTGLMCEPSTSAASTAPTNMIEATGGAEGVIDGCERRAGGDSVAWTLRCGGATGEYVVGTAVSPAGEIFVGLILQNYEESGPIRFGDFELVPGALHDIVILKLSSDGEVLWVKHISGPGWESLHRLRGCGDGVAIAGSVPRGAVDLGGGVIEDEHFIAVFDGDGGLRWSRSLPTTDVLEHYIDVRDMACDACGGLSITGIYRGPTDLGGGPMAPALIYDGFVAHYDAEGAWRWGRGLGAGTGQEPDSWAEAWGMGIAHSPGGEVVLAGSFSGTIDPGGGPMISNRGSDALVVKYDRDGEQLWSLQIGPNGEQFGKAIAIDATGRPTLAGLFYDRVSVGSHHYENVHPFQSPDIHGFSYDVFLALLDPVLLSQPDEDSEPVFDHAR